MISHIDRHFDKLASLYVMFPHVYVLCKHTYACMYFRIHMEIVMYTYIYTHFLWDTFQKKYDYIGSYKQTYICRRVSYNKHDTHAAHTGTHSLIVSLFLSIVPNKR